MVHMRASPRGLATVVICLVLGLAVYGMAGAANWFSADLTFDVTVQDVVSGTYLYTYDLTIPDLEDPNPDISEPVRSFCVTGAFDVDTATISQTGYNGYGWYAGEIVYPGDSPFWDSGLQNPTNIPVMWWIRSTLAGSGTGDGQIGSFSFVSTSPPMDRDWVAHSQNTFMAEGSALGPTPELSPLLLLLGQGVPILGWIGLRRRRGS